MVEQSTEHERRAMRRDEERIKYNPFNIQWLDSSYQQTCLPDSPWEKVKTKLFDFSL